VNQLGFALTVALQTPEQKAALVALVLAQHRGKTRAIRVVELAHDAGISERDVRHAVSALREDGIAVCSHPTVGYWIASSPQELDESCQFLRSRAMKSLVLEARMRNVALPVLLGQLALTETVNH
jgi:predicted DNA-binding transcriptional regulator